MTAEEFLENSKNQNYAKLKDVVSLYFLEQDLIEFAKYHVEEALKAAAQEVSLDKLEWYDYYDFSKGVETISNKEEIQNVLNAYPLENIK